MIDNAKCQPVALDCGDNAELLLAIARRDELVAAAKEAESLILPAGRRYLMAAIADEQELLRRSEILYWDYSELPVSLIAEVLFGDPKQGAKVRSVLPGRPAACCSKCGKQIVALSRSRASELRRAAATKCDSCHKVEADERDVLYKEAKAAQIARSEALRSMPYREYLLTEEWRETRLYKLKQAKFKCQLCNSSGLLDVHHRTYERRGNEHMSDLVVLCRSCHSRFHGK